MNCDFVSVGCGVKVKENFSFNTFNSKLLSYWAITMNDFSRGEKVDENVYWYSIKSI